MPWRVQLYIGGEYEIVKLGTLSPDKYYDPKSYLSKAGASIGTSKRWYNSGEGANAAGPFLGAAFQADSLVRTLPCTILESAVCRLPTDGVTIILLVDEHL